MPKHKLFTHARRARVGNANTRALARVRIAGAGAPESPHIDMHAVTSISDRLKDPILSSPQTTKEWDEATRHLRKYVDEHFPLESPESQEKCEKVISELSMMLTVQAPAPHTVAPPVARSVT